MLGFTKIKKNYKTIRNDLKRLQSNSIIYVWLEVAKKKKNASMKYVSDQHGYFKKSLPASNGMGGGAVFAFFYISPFEPDIGSICAGGVGWDDQEKGRLEKGCLKSNEILE